MKKPTKEYQKSEGILMKRAGRNIWFLADLYYAIMGIVSTPSENYGLSPISSTTVHGQSVKT